MKAVILIFVSVLIIFTNCSKQRLSNVVYEGTIYDSIGGAPSKNITIGLSACEPRDGRNFCAQFGVGSATTDENGHFKIKAKSARSDRYFISTTGNHFSEVSEGDLKDEKYTVLYIYK